eukprot:2545153-Rhodomonas_salina.1
MARYAAHQNGVRLCVGPPIARVGSEKVRQARLAIACASLRSVQHFTLSTLLPAHSSQLSQHHRQASALFKSQETGRHHSCDADIESHNPCTTLIFSRAFCVTFGIDTATGSSSPPGTTPRRHRTPPSLGKLSKK